MKVMIDKFVLEEFEVKIVDQKANTKEGIPEKFHLEDRWLVKFGDNPIAINFLSEEAAREYIKVYGYLALWTALWTYRFPVQWDETLKVENLSIEVKHKEKK